MDNTTSEIPFVGAESMSVSSCRNAHIAKALVELLNGDEKKDKMSSSLPLCLVITSLPSLIRLGAERDVLFTCGCFFLPFFTQQCIALQ